MKKASTGATKQSTNFSRQRLTIGLDPGDRSTIRRHPAGTRAEHNSARLYARGSGECRSDEHIPTPPLRPQSRAKRSKGVAKGRHQL